MQDGQYGIEESKDVINYAGKIVAALKKHKADDGKIDSGEIAATLVGTVPDAIRAYVGSDDISKELAELSDEERKELLDMGMPVLMSLVSLFYKLDV